MQIAVPDELRGRVMGLYALVFARMTPIGALIMGTVAEHWGVSRPARWAAPPACC